MEALHLFGHAEVFFALGNPAADLAKELSPFHQVFVDLRKLLNIADIPDEGLEQELDIPVVPGENVGSGTALVRIKVFRTGKKVLVQGSLRVSLSLRCSRCLQEFSYPVAADFSDEYSPAEEFESEGEQELTAGEMDLIVTCTFYPDIASMDARHATHDRQPQARPAAFESRLTR